MKSNLYRDTETGEIIPVEQLRADYDALASEGMTDAQTFGQYLRNCLDKNGFLEEV